MEEKLFNKILSLVTIISVLGFFVISGYILLVKSPFTYRRFAVLWASIYVLAVTLGFKSNIEAHKSRLKRFAVEWLITCGVGCLPALALLIYG